MQAGFEYTGLVRAGRIQETAQSAMGEFISGNYFRTFGLQPAAGRLLQDSDDVQGAPMVAVMSYDAVEERLCAAIRGGGQHVLDQHEAGDGGGHCAEGVLRRPDVEHAAGVLSADRVDAGAAGAEYVHDPEQSGLHYRAGEAGCGAGAAAGEGERAAEADLRRASEFAEARTSPCWRGCRWC